MIFMRNFKCKNSLVEIGNGNILGDLGQKWLHAFRKFDAVKEISSMFKLLSHILSSPQFMLLLTAFLLPCFISKATISISGKSLSWHCFLLLELFETLQLVYLFWDRLNH
jgi:hypothetical protein